MHSPLLSGEYSGRGGLLLFANRAALFGYHMVASATYKTLAPFVQMGGFVVKYPDHKVLLMAFGNPISSRICRKLWRVAARNYSPRPMGSFSGESK
jgi:hypothetical protein